MACSGATLLLRHDKRKAILVQDRDDRQDQAVKIAPNRRAAAEIAAF
jgi:hypothetical protein